MLLITIDLALPLTSMESVKHARAPQESYREIECGERAGAEACGGPYHGPLITTPVETPAEHGGLRKSPADSEEPDP